MEGPVSKLSPEEIARYAQDAGFEGRDLTVAVAIAIAESGGRTEAHNDKGLDDSYGLWQINMYKELGPARRDQFGLDENRDLVNPETNAEAAFEISGRGQSFQPWTTYTGGAYKQYLDEAEKAAKAVRGDKGNGDKEDGDKDRDRRPEHAQASGTGEPGRLRVDPDALSGYAKAARNISDELATLRGKELSGVRGLAEDSFGKLGKETGFAVALDRFGGALQEQVKAVGANADKLAGSVAKTARHYRDQDEDIAQDLLGLLRDN
jgi:hypothetical protein